MSLGAVVLCGGQSRRMGRPKAWLPFGPELMLERVVRLVGEAVGPVVVVAAPGQELPPLPDRVTVVRDPVSGRGPLQGLAAGLAALPDAVELAYATATDVPFLQPAWIARLHGLIGDHDLAIPFVEGYHHPLAALYRRATILPAVEALLKEDRLRPVFLMEVVKTRVVEAEELREVDPELDTLRNLNSPEDYSAALVRAGLAT
jgi:molybdopterin-guanine dinucleotide biosynthesis protein A